MTLNPSSGLKDRLPATVAAAVRRSCTRCGSPRYVFNINVNGNLAAVQIGDYNVANVPSPRSSGATVLQTDSSNAVSSTNVHVTGDAARICPLGCLQQLVSSSVQHTHRISRSRKRLAKHKKSTSVSKFFPMVKKRKCSHGEPSKKPKRKLPRRNLSSSSSSLSNEFVGEMRLLASQSDSFNLEQALDLFHNCITHLHPLRDDGQWDHFELATQDLLEKNADNMACQTIIHLEKSVALSLQGKLTESENLINDSMKNIPQMSGSIRLLLDVLMNCYMCQVSRRKQLLEQAKLFVETAKEKSRGFPPCLAIAIVLYEEGGYKRDFAATVKGWKKEQAIAEAKEVMERCVELCCRLDRQQEVYVRKQHIAISRMAIMGLQCETKVSRSERISTENIKEAKTLLETLGTDYYCQTEKQGGRIQRLIANVDLCYRLVHLAKAEQVGRKALEIAKRLHFNLDVNPLEERLAEIHQKIIQSPSNVTFREIPGIIDSFSDSSQNSSPYSSEYEEDLSPISEVFLPKNIADLVIFS